MHVAMIFVGGLGGDAFIKRDGEPISIFDRVKLASESNPLLHAYYLSDIGYVVGNCPDLVGLIQQIKRQYGDDTRIIVAIHSMGWEPGERASNAGLVDYLIAADPVGLPFKSHTVWPRRNGERQPGVFVKAALTLGIQQLNIYDGPEITDFSVEPYSCHHNDLIHNYYFQKIILEAIKNSWQQKTPA